MFDILKKYATATYQGFDRLTMSPTYNTKRRKRKPSVFYGDKKGDMERLADDWAVIGNDMRIAIASYGGRNGR